MTIYEVIEDANNYRSLLPEDDAFWTWTADPKNQAFDCLPMSDRWEPPMVRCPNPKLPAGDFWWFASGALAIAPRAVELLRTQLEISGELLDLPYKGESFKLLNVTACADCLNQEQTQWAHSRQTGERLVGQIEKYVFQRKWMPESSIFKIPETSRGAIYTAAGRFDPEDEFQPTVERLGLKGLIFNKIWEG